MKRILQATLLGVCSLVLISCAKSGFVSSADKLEIDLDAEFMEKAREEAGKLPAELNQEDLAYRGELSPTIYYHPMIQDELNGCKTGRWQTLMGGKGVELMKVCSTTYQTCAMEGSCQINRQKVVRSFNYSSMVGGQYIFVEMKKGADCFYGMGVSSSCLDPFYTVAADMTHHKPGEVIYVPKVAGLILPNGEKHTGFFVVRDRGGAIKGPHRFDFFSGTWAWDDPKNPFFQLQLADKGKRFAYFRVTGPTAEKVLKAREYPSLPDNVVEMESFITPWPFDDVSESVD